MNYFKCFLLLGMFFSVLYSEFHVDDYFKKKKYRYHFTSSGQIRYVKNFSIELKNFSRIFKVNDFTYFFNHEAIMGNRGITLSKGDAKFFKKVVEFYEKRYLEKKQSSIQKKSKLTRKTNQQKISKENLTDIAYIGSDEKIQKIDYIFLDAGHGGRDPGAVFYGYQEKNIALLSTLELASILRKKLVKRNTRVVLTRRDDKYVSLEERCRFANEFLKKDENGLFISLHFNIWINPVSRGFEIYYLSHDDEINQERVYLHLEDMGVSRLNYFKKIFSYLEVVQYQRESFYLANLVTELLRNKISDYSIRDNSKSDIFYVLRGVLMPSVLVELGFISNRRDMEFINDKKKRTHLLGTIAEAIVIYVDDFKASKGFQQGLFLEKNLD